MALNYHYITMIPPQPRAKRQVSPWRSDYLCVHGDPFRTIDHTPECLAFKCTTSSLLTKFTDTHLQNLLEQFPLTMTADYSDPQYYSTPTMEKSPRDLYKTGECSDLTVTCQGRTFQVHKTIIFPQCPFLAAAYDGRVSLDTALLGLAFACCTDTKSRRR